MEREIFLVEKLWDMRCRASDIKRLMDEVGEETRMTLVHGNFPAIHDILEARYKSQFGKKLPFFREYLYRKLFVRVKNGVKKNQFIELNAANVDAIAQVLGYDSYGHFERIEHPDINRLLGNCVGNWYSYMRSNSGSNEVMVSPVKIFQDGKSVYMELNGPLRKFKGLLKLKGNCLYCLMENENEKNLHFVLKVGFSHKPNVLQGVFSGLSSGGDPVAGREVLVRQELELKHKKLKISELVNSKNPEEKVIGEYFCDEDKNILKAGQVSTFDLNDLRKK